MSSNENDSFDSQKNEKEKSIKENIEEEKEEEDEIDIKSLKSKNETKNNLISINPLYPTIRNSPFFDRNNSPNHKILRLAEEKPNLRKDSLTLEEFKKNKLHITDKFLNDLISEPCPLPKTQIIEVISFFIRNSTLINKLENSYNWKNEEELTNLCNLIAKNLSYEKYNKGDILFKVGDIGNKFYFILKGYVSILKLKEISKAKMSYSQYFNFCLQLLKNNEYHILEETLKKNSNIIPISTINQLKKLYTIIIKKKLYENILSDYIYNSTSLSSFFTANEETLEKYDINLRELQTFEDLEKIGEWKSYLIKRVKPSKDELGYYDKYKEYIIRKNEYVKLWYYIYDDFLYLGEGFYFGENALEKGNIYTGGKRNATIRAETEVFCGSLKGADYLNLIEPKKRLEKLKEIKFIYNNFFFKEMSIFLFEKNYFHLFSACEYKKDDIIIKTGDPLNNLSFIKDGEVSVEIYSSLINIQNLIKYLYEYIFKNEFFANLPLNKQKKLINNKTIDLIKAYMEEPIFKKLRGYSIKFNEELNKKRNFKIAKLGENDIIGLEEIFLNISYITKVTAISKRVNCYQLSEEHLEHILNGEKDIIIHYLKTSINKIIVLIQRLQNIKQHYIQYFISKYEKNVDNEEQKDVNNNINNNNSLIMKSQKSEINLRNNDNGIEKIENYNSNGFNEFNKYNILENKKTIELSLSNSNFKKSNKSNMKTNHQLSDKMQKKKLLINFKKNNNSNKNSHININILDNNKIKPRHNFDYNNGIDTKNIQKKKKFFKTTNGIKILNFDNKNKRNLIIGKKNISISALKNKFNKIEFLSQDNNDLIQIIQSTKYNDINNEKNKDEPMKDNILKGTSNYLKYHLSYVPLYDNKKIQTKNNPNFFKTESITSNLTPFQLTIFSNNTNNNQTDRNNYNENNSNYDSIFYNNNNQLNNKENQKNRTNQKRFINNDYYISRNIPKVFNLKSNEKKHGNINQQIKEFYKELKSRGCLSYIPSSDNNTFYTRKFNPKYKSVTKYYKSIRTNASQTVIGETKKFLPLLKQIIK